MKLGWILSGNKDVAGARIHGWNIHNSLESATFKYKNLQSNILYAPKGFEKDLKISKDEIDKIIALKYDILIFQKIYSGEHLKYFLDSAKSNKIKIIYIGMDKINELLSDYADVIIVVSDNLKKQLTPVNRKKATYVFDGYEQDKKICKKHTNKKSIKLVYISNNTYEKFPQIETLPQNVTLKIIGPPQRRMIELFPEKEIFTKTNYKYKYVEWNSKTVLKELLECDVGVIPYPDELLQTNSVKNKSNNRLIFLMSLGIPTICSPTKEYKKLIVNKKNGFIANNQKDWNKFIIFLRDNPEQRKEIGLLARKTVLEKYSLENQVKEYIKIIQKLK